IKPMPSNSDSAFEGSVVTNPAQLTADSRYGAAGPATPQKMAALRLLAQAQAAMGRGDCVLRTSLPSKLKPSEFPITNSPKEKHAPGSCCFKSGASKIDREVRE
ncbi:MAG TPA: hypothetical protein P5307_08025, partial [Pirellulaceae bacterium]|nr:hypothetical protein [Pirellulaceae bacterium]